jgi:hypothetical protein
MIGRRCGALNLCSTINIILQEDRDSYYDWALVHKVRRSLQVLREKDDARGILGVLETCIRANFAGTESVRLYSQVRYEFFHRRERC